MVMRYCTRVIAIRAGTVIYDGDPRLTAAQLNRVYGSEIQHPALSAVES
jgi:ABC-type phosphate/phosphonate transport system ATPase subunit